MKIADSVLKHHLRNVLWLGGGACGGKSTLAGLLARKYGSLAYHCDDKSPEHHQIANSTDHPTMLQPITDWDYFFNRPVEEYVQWLHKNAVEHMEMVVADLMYLGRKQKVIAEGIFPAPILRGIASRSKVIFLHAEPEIIRSQYFERDHTRGLLSIVSKLADPDAALENALHAVVQASRENFQSAAECGFTCFLRDSFTTLEESVTLVEHHFGDNLGDAVK